MAQHAFKLFYFTLIFSQYPYKIYKLYLQTGQNQIYLKLLTLN